jgi:hypothetical protein
MEILIKNLELDFEKISLLSKNNSLIVNEFNNR